MKGILEDIGMGMISFSRFTNRHCPAVTAAVCGVGEPVCSMAQTVADTLNCCNNMVISKKMLKFAE